MANEEIYRIYYIYIAHIIYNKNSLKKYILRTCTAKAVKYLVSLMEYDRKIRIIQRKSELKWQICSFATI